MLSLMGSRGWIAPSPGGKDNAPGGTGPQRQISLLFDVFVLNQRLRSLLALALAGSGMRPDEYAVYSLLFETGSLTPTEMAAQMGMPLTTVLDYVRAMKTRGHAVRARNPTDRRSYRLSLSAAGLTAFRRASAAWNRGLARLEPALTIPVEEVRRALQALDDAAAETLERLRTESIRQPV
jgi:DNA-binding MarR family transcriptional regulator